IGHLCGLTVLALCAPAAGAPWIEPGDLRMRHSLQQLADQGATQVPLTTWPLMWVDAQRLRESVARPKLTPAQRDSWDYIEFEADQQARLGPRVTFELNAANEPLAFRSFASRPR